MNDNIATNAERLGSLLTERIPQIGYQRPEATYLAWLDCAALGLGDDPAQAFLDRGRVALTSGVAFGPVGRAMPGSTWRAPTRCSPRPSTGWPGCSERSFGVQPAT